MKRLTILSFLVVLLSIYSCDNAAVDPPTDPQSPLSIPITPVIPVDVNPELQKKLKAQDDNFYDLNIEFNKFSWQAFVAIFWPMDAEGNPMPNFTDEGESEWLSWKESFQVYREDGGTPAPWGSPRTGGALSHDMDLVAQEDFRIYLTKETPAHKGLSKNIADEVDQAFAGRLFDQNGNTVVYEVLMNEAEFDYVKNNKLYNINGQIDFTKDGSIANFPKGNYEKDSVGAIEIKLAWKILMDSDYKDRYYQNQGYILDEKTKQPVPVNLGLIGFHISQKTPTGKQWVWSTFEHIDNLDQNTIEKNGKQTPIHPTLYDPYCEICPVNVDLYRPPTSYTYTSGKHGDYWAKYDTSYVYPCDSLKQNKPVQKIVGSYDYTNTNVMKTQSKRMIDIPVRVQQVNKMMQAYFKSKGSVFQYYQLIDTQYPTDQDATPGNNTEEGYQIPESVVNKPGGNPNLAYLTNITMETFFQGGNQSASAFMEANPASNIQVFGTESCMGCHSSAGIHALNAAGRDTILPQLSGDFSWLLSQKANWDASRPIPGSKSK